MFILFFIVTLSASLGLSVEQHHYLKKTGSEIHHFDWHLEKGEDFKLTTVLGKELDVTRMDNDFSTQSWTVDDAKVKTHVRVSRKDNVLTVNGVFKGKKVARTIRIDSSPWYQALSLSLRQFVDQSCTHVEFWSIRPDNLNIHRLQASRENEEIKIVQGVPSEVVKLKIQLTGLKSVVWRCYYWLRKADGLFVRYEGPSGPPGWPLTTVELLEPFVQTTLDENLSRVNKFLE